MSDAENLILRLTNNLRVTEMERDAGDKVADNLRSEIERLKTAKNAEIERLKAKIERLTKKNKELVTISSDFWCDEQEHKKLHARAAKALEAYAGDIEVKFIGELRKAAEWSMK